jgi:hypothetical protein
MTLLGTQLEQISAAISTLTAVPGELHELSALAAAPGDCSFNAHKRRLAEGLLHRRRRWTSSGLTAKISDPRCPQMSWRRNEHPPGNLIHPTYPAAYPTCPCASALTEAAAKKSGWLTSREPAGRLSVRSAAGSSAKTGLTAQRHARQHGRAALGHRAPSNCDQPQSGATSRFFNAPWCAPRTTLARPPMPGDWAEPRRCRCTPKGLPQVMFTPATRCSVAARSWPGQSGGA